MKLKIFSWNVKGANDGEKGKLIKSVIRMQKVDLICLLETKVQEVSLQMVRSLGIGRFLDWGAMEAQGGALWYFGTTRFWSCWIWSVEDFPSLVVLGILRMALCGCLLVCRSILRGKRPSRKSWELCGMIRGV